MNGKENNVKIGKTQSTEKIKIRTTEKCLKKKFENRNSGNR